ncbi:hypothetical protein [Brotaphodocola sp.]|uniref:hypothetical protein n=1 Tax=Brotaphodocola sp. TaxID=3073577 RepID=UPI003D7D749C
MVSMIPFGLLAGFAEFVECPKECFGEIGVEKGSAREKEIRIIGIEEEKFCFRLAEWGDDAQSSPESFRICFYEMEKRAYREIRITDFEITGVSKKEFWTEISVKVPGHSDQVEAPSEFSRAVQKLLRQYDRYIRLKLECCDAEVSEALIGYPADLDEVHMDSLTAQKKRWFETVSKKELTEEPEKNREDRGEVKTEIALELDQPYLYEKYLSCSIEDFSHWYWKKNGLENHRLALSRPDRLYIGNAFCPLLFPDTGVLSRLLEKANAENLGITIVTSYLREEAWESFENLLEKLEQWCEETGTETVEMVVNDWAVADRISAQISDSISLSSARGTFKEYKASQTAHVSHQSHIIPILGVLLNKRRKDPRNRYLNSNYHDRGNGENNLYADFYRDFLKNEFHIERYEWESIAGLPGHRFPGEKNSLHLPFYQTNTSQYCTLYAGCVYGERGHQRLITACPKYCNRFVYLYPEHLKMVGRGNSLFGFDAQVLEELEACGKESKWSGMEFWRELGIDRLVINLMEVGDEENR